MGLTSKLFISSESINGCEEIIELLYSLGVECQVLNSFNIIKSHNFYRKENGAIIKFYELNKIEFKNKIWPALENKFKLNCGFIETEDYKGCIKDWPKVFRKTKCPGNILNNHYNSKIKNDLNN